MSDPDPEPRDNVVPLKDRSVIHVAPEEVMQPGLKRGPFRDISFEGRMLRVMLFSALLVAAAMGVFYAMYAFGLFDPPKG